MENTLSPSVYSVFCEGRTTYVLLTLQESSDGGSTWSAKDVSASSLSVRFRAYKRPIVDGASGVIIDEAMTKVTAASGIVGYYVLFTTDYGQVECEVVVVDSAVTGQATKSTYREVLWRRWKAEVIPAVMA